MRFELALPVPQPLSNKHAPLPSDDGEAYRSAMRFQVLGPLGVRRKDESLRLGGPKQRLVLAHLLIRANEVVSADLLIDEIWGDEPPEAARPSLYSYVSHLKKALGAERLVARPGGYTLRASPEEIDAARFEKLVSQGRRRLGSDPAAASRTLREAHGLWHGQPFSDLSTELSLQAEIERLSDLRLGSLEDRIEAELALGRHADLVPELERLVSEHPLRERFCMQLMLALYRTGRQADALAAYHRLRRALDEDLGLEPSPTVEQLQHQILVHDPALTLRGEPLRGYRVVEKIGSGAHGTVYRAAEPQTGRDVGIKVLDARVANDTEFVRRFDAGTRRIARLDHAHVVPLYDWWREPDAAYLVMPLLRGGSLDERLSNGHVSSVSALKWAEQIGAALTAAHRQGVIHGDIRPSNVLLDGADNAYLTDFAVGYDPARDRSAIPPAADVRFLAPERRAGDGPSAAGDVYAFGVLLHDLLRGATAGHDGADLRETLEQATSASPAERHPSAADLAASVRRGLLAPSARAGSADGLAEPSRNPYKGLRAFEEQDADDFFGREELTQGLLSRMQEQGEASRLLAVVGPSGSGKSSVVNAGLLPALRAGGVANSADWLVATMTPGDRPLEKLEAALLSVAVGAPVGLAELLGAGEGLKHAVERALPSGTELLLVIDQFEELFTLVEDEEERQRFLDLLSDTASDAGSRVRIVLTLRADFYDRPLRHERFGRQLGARTHAVLPMTPEELERVIVRPAARAGLRPDEGLVARIVAEMSKQPGGLPLLQYALTELWEHRDGPRLSLRSYESSGGIAGAIGRRAGHLVRQLDEAGQQAARQLFLRLVELGEGTPDTARRVRQSELRALESEQSLIDSVVDSFARYRLLLLDRDPESREPTIELAHEALLRAWPRLQQWVDDVRDDLRQQRRLALLAGQWLEAGRDTSFLLSGTRLLQVEHWAASARVVLARWEREYLEASLAERGRLLRLEEERRVHEAALERRALTRMRALVAVLTVGTLVAGALSLFAMAESGRAAREARLSTARELAAGAVANLDIDPEGSILLALEAVETTRSVDGTVLREAEEALHRAVRTSRLVYTVPQVNGGLAISPDGSLFATTGREGALTLRDTVSGSELAALNEHDGEALAVAFSPDARLAASAGSDGKVILWDVASHRPISTLQAEGVALGSPVFSPDGRLLATDTRPIYHDGAVRLWDVATGEETLRLSGHALWRPVFSPDGGLLAGASDDNTALIVDLETGDALTLSGHIWPVGRVAFSPDGLRLATIANDGTARTWDVQTGAPLETFYRHRGSAWALAWSPDGSLLATGGTDGTARLWDAATGERLTTLNAHAASVANVAFTPDGRHLITTGDDNTTRMWDVTAGGARDWLTVPAAQLIYVGAAFSPDGRSIAVPAEPSGVTLWDVASGDQLRHLPSESKLTSVEFSPDGRMLAAGSDVTDAPPVWDVATGKLLFALAGHSDSVRAVAFSPDGRHIVTGSFDGTARLWDSATGRQVRVLLANGGEVVSVAFNADGSVLATGDADGILTVWDGHRFEVLQSVRAHDYGVLGIAFTADGLPVTAGADGAARVWDLQHPESSLVTLRGHAGSVNQVAVSPDGSRIATAGDDRLAKIWEADTGRELLTFYGHEFTLYGVAFSPDGRYLATGSADGTVALHLLPIDEFVELARTRVTRSFTDDECRQYLHLEACPPAD